MTDEKTAEVSKKYPDLVVSPIIYNDKGEILLVKLPKWGDYWVIPGGHIEAGETAEQALKREILEETGLEIDNIEFINWQEKVNPEGFYKKIHFVAFNYCARMSGGKLTKSDEMEDYVWIKPEEALKTLKIPPTMVKSIEFYLEHLENKKNGYEDKYNTVQAKYQNLLKRTADEGKNYVNANVAAFIFNNENKLLLVRAKTWNNLWVVPGGMVKFGESQLAALKRKMKDEVGIEVGDMEYLTTIELIKTKERPDFHAVVNEFIVRPGNQDVKLNNDHSEYDWRAPEDWLKDKDLYPNVREAIKFYLNEYLPKQNCESLYKRALADYQNLLKQTAKEKMEFAVYANEQMLKEILPVYDHLKMSLEFHNGESTDEWLQGVKHVVKQFKDVLNKIGVEEIIANKKFDHNLMDAVQSEETEDESLDGQVAKQIKAGYKLNGKVIEAAKVVVYKLKN